MNRKGKDYLGIPGIIDNLGDFVDKTPKKPKKDEAYCAGCFLDYPEYPKKWCYRIPCDGGVSHFIFVPKNNDYGLLRNILVEQIAADKIRNN